MPLSLIFQANKNFQRSLFYPARFGLCFTIQAVHAIVYFGGFPSPDESSLNLFIAYTAPLPQPANACFHAD
ncbi:MAG: hypothetical protein U9N87_01940 [Planctomycetota bacterium]|nr:hypothetical protein [Planctomycetota bacterium]